jgi:glycosyltransferase involved in cell wall biosynthesis
MKKTILLSFFCFFAAVYCNAQKYNHVKLMQALKQVIDSRGVFTADIIENDYLVLNNKEEEAQPLIFIFPKEDDEGNTRLLIRAYENFNKVVESHPEIRDKIIKYITGGGDIFQHISITYDDGYFIYETMMENANKESMALFVDQFKRTYGEFISRILVIIYNDFVKVEGMYGSPQSVTEAKEEAKTIESFDWVKNVSINGINGAIVTFEDNKEDIVYRLCINYYPPIKIYKAILYMDLHGTLHDYYYYLDQKGEKMTPSSAESNFNNAMYYPSSNLSAFVSNDDLFSFCESKNDFLSFVGRIVYNKNKDDFVIQINKLLKDMRKAKDLFY